MNLRRRVNELAKKYLGELAVKEIYLPTPRTAFISGVFGLELLFNFGCSGTPDLHFLVKSDPSLHKSFEDKFQSGKVRRGYQAPAYEAEAHTVYRASRTESNLDKRIRLWKRVLNCSRDLELRRAHLRNMKKEAYNSSEPERDEYIKAYEHLARRYGYIYR